MNLVTILNLQISEAKILMKILICIAFYNTLVMNLKNFKESYDSN